MKLKLIRLLCTVFVIVFIFSCLAINSAAAPTFDPVYPLNGAYTVTCLYYYNTGKIHDSKGYSKENTVDFSASTGTEVYTIESGTVEEAGWTKGGFGYRIIIIHDNGEKSLYAHLSKIYVEKGQSVSRGECIALSGNTGESTGPHLHFAYSGGNLLREYWIPQYYESFTFENNVRSNNNSFNSDKWIVNLIDDCYSVKSGLYYYYNGSNAIWNYVSASSAKRVPLYQNATVTAKSGLKVRERPDINSAQIGYLNSGASVRVANFPITDGSGYTWRYALDSGGWVCKDYLNITGGNMYVEGVYKIQTASCDKYLTYVGNAQADAGIVIYEDNGSINQEWYLEPFAYHSGLNGTVVYHIYPAGTTSVALDSDPSDRRNLHLWGDTNIPGAQQWFLYVNTDGSVRILNAETSLCLDIDSCRTDNSTPVLAWDYNGTSNQKWYIVESH